MDDSPAARLRVVLEELAADYQIGTWIELWVRARHDEGTRDLRQRIDDEFRALIEGIVDHGQRSGAFGGPVPGDTALIVAAVVDGFTIQATLHDSKVNPGYMMSAFVDVAELLLECELPAVTREARRDD